MRRTFGKLNINVWPEHTAAQKVAVELCKNVSGADAEKLVKEVCERRDKLGSICESTIVAFVAIQLYIAGYVWLGLPTFKALGIELGESSTSCFIAYVIYNLLWTIRMGAFFKVLVLDAMFDILVTKCPMPNMTQAMDGHISQFLFSNAVSDTVGKGDRAFSFRLLRNYSRNGVPLLYTMYFYVTIIWFIFSLVLSMPKGVAGLVMAATLIIMTASSTMLGLKTVILPRAKSDV